MKEKINIRMFLMGIVSLILAVVMTTNIYHNAFEKQQKQDIKMYGNLLVSICENIDDYSELSNYHDDKIRVTVVSKDGDVLFESDTDTKSMNNHLDRQEIIDAFKNGTGESTRTSYTLGYDTYYYAVLLPEGNVIRVAIDVKAMFDGYHNAFPGIAIVALAVMLISVVFSIMLTKSLVKPIEKMAENLDDIDKEVPYKELKPFAMAVKEYQLEKESHTNMRQEFTANVSHELKTPLTSISGYAEMIENGMAQAQDIKIFAGKIHFEAKRLLNLIADILKLSELDEGKSEMVIQRSETDLLEIAQNVVNILQFKAEQAKIDLSIIGESTVIIGNKRLLEDMIYNLCDNAIKYNKPGGKVIIHIGRKNGKAEVSVLDNGIGIPKEHQERVFERFYRVDKSRSKATGGTGLGLAIVKHVAITHNGKIHIKSETGVGTEIKVEFNS